MLNGRESTAQKGAKTSRLEEVHKVKERLGPGASLLAIHRI